MPLARCYWFGRSDWTHRNGCPRQDSNLRTRLRRPALYPLSYEGVPSPSLATPSAAESDVRVLGETLRYPDLMEGQVKPRILSSTTMRSSSDCSGSTSGWRASRSSEDRTRGYALGVEVYVTKPFDPSHLVEIVRGALARKTAQA